MLLPETLKLHDQTLFEFHYVYFLPWKNQMVDALLAHGGQVVCMKASNNVELITKVPAITAYVRRHDIQLIHAHLPWAGILARLVGKFSKIPIIYTEHNKQERYHVATRTMNIATLNWLSCIVSVSDDVERSIRKYKPVLTARLEKILNGVNTRHFIPGQFDGKNIRKALRIPDDAPVIGTIAVFRFQKRLDVWIDLAQMILAKIPDAHFVLVGDGPLKSQLIRKVEELPLRDRIHFAGLQTEIRPYLAAFDVYMMTSVFEGLPVALLEAMASGCAVVSTNAGGIKEVIRHKIDGLLCEVDEPERIVELVIALIADKENRRELAYQARNRIVSMFSMENMVSKLEKLYKELIL